MKNKNILLAIFIIIVSIGGILIYNLIPQFETTEFNQNSIVKISEGSTTTLESTETPTTTIGDSEDSEMIDIQSSEIEILLKNNSTKNISEEFVTYLLVGSDRRNENSSLSRGFVEGQRADVIILTIINKENPPGKATGALTSLSSSAYTLSAIKRNTKLVKTLALKFMKLSHSHYRILFLRLRKNLTNSSA